MSVLFVWPAAIFFLLIWWTFFSGWSGLVRYGSVALGIAGIVAFFSIFRLERFDGDMTPTQISYRWKPSSEQRAREYLEQIESNVGRIEAEPAEGPLVAEDADWPGFRGPNRDGVITGLKLRTDWDARPPKTLWRHFVGKAWSSFAVIGDLAFTQEQRGDQEAVVAYKISDGSQVWVHTDNAEFVASVPQGGPGPRATPQFDQGKLYSLGGTGILNCLDARTGQAVWTTNILKDSGTPEKPTANLEWGMSGSPLIVDQFVIVIPGGTAGQSVAAYDKLTGKRVWATGQYPATYASPTVGSLNGQKVILAPLGTGVAGHSLDDGKELWFFKWTNAPKVCGAMPVLVDDQSVLYGIGYGEGTVRLQIGQDWSVTQKWHSNRFRPKFNDFVIRDGHAYGLDDGTLTCLDIETGKVKWKSGRYGYGQVLLVDDILLIVSEPGAVVLVPAVTSKQEPVATYQALDSSDITWNQPVLTRGRLLIRNANEATCIDLQ